MTMITAFSATKPLALIRQLVEALDPNIENVIDAHGFSFSALTVDKQGALLQFALPQTEWQLTLGLPSHGGSPHIQLQKGEPAAPQVSLLLCAPPDEKQQLSAALATAMELFNSLQG